MRTMISSPAALKNKAPANTNPINRFMILLLALLRTFATHVCGRGPNRQAWVGRIAWPPTCSGNVGRKKDSGKMKTLANWSVCLAVVAAGTLAGCSRAAKSPDVAASIRVALDQAGFKKVSVDQDRDKGVVTLSGNVGADADKAQAEALAKSLAGGEVVADQIAVLPVGAERDARAINSDLDKGIEQNLDAALIQSQLHQGVKYAV